VQPGLELLAAHDLILELPAEYPNHLDDVAEVARRHPGLAIVVDHLGKPPLGTPHMADWAELIRQAASAPNVYAKVSGLNTCTSLRDWDADDLEPAVAVAFEAFGADRLLCGSDWPVALLNGDYARVWSETTLAVRRTAGSDAEQILTKTASSLYRLEPSSATR
jgi:L-fuconolactonase